MQHGTELRRTSMDLQVRFKTLRWHGVRQNNIAEAVVQLPSHKLAVLLEWRIQKLLHTGQAPFVHLQRAWGILSPHLTNP